MLSSLKFSNKIAFHDEEGNNNRIGTRPIPRKKKQKNRIRRKNKSQYSKNKQKKKPPPVLCTDTNKCTHLNFLLNQGKVTYRAPPMVTYTAPIIKTAEPTFDLTKGSNETDVNYEKRLDTILGLKQPQLMMFYQAMSKMSNTGRSDGSHTIATNVRDMLRPTVPTASDADGSDAASVGSDIRIQPLGVMTGGSETPPPGLAPEPAHIPSQIPRRRGNPSRGPGSRGPYRTRAVRAEEEAALRHRGSTPASPRVFLRGASPDIDQNRGRRR